MSFPKCPPELHAGGEIAQLTFATSAAPLTHWKGNSGFQPIFATLMYDVLNHLHVVVSYPFEA